MSQRRKKITNREYPVLGLIGPCACPHGQCNCTVNRPKIAKSRSSRRASATKKECKQCGNTDAKCNCTPARAKRPKSATKKGGRRCVQCKKEFQGYGHNGAPLADGIVCNQCNQDVITERLKRSANCGCGSK